MIKKILILIIALSAVILSAQVKNYDISSFEEPNHTEIDIDANLKIGIDFSEYYKNAGDNDDNEMNSKLSSLFPDMYFSFFKNVYTHRIQHRFSNYIGFSLDKSNYDNFSAYYDGSNPTHNETEFLTTSIDNRFSQEFKFYLFKEFYFSENSSYNFIFNELKEDKTDFKQIDRTHSVYLSGSFGYGRINDVSAAYKIKLLFTDLKKQNLLSKELSKTDIEEVATEFVKLNKKNYFDSREKKIELISEIAAFIKEKGLIKEDNGIFYTNLYDYLFNYYVQRDSGFDLSFTGSYSNNLGTGSYENELTSFYGKFQYIKPIRTNIDIEFDYINKYTFGNKLKDFSQLESNIELAGTYYFNTRAKMILSSYYQYTKTENDYSYDEEIEKRLVFGSYNNYFLNKNIELYGRVYLIGEMNDYDSIDNSDSWDFRIYTGIKYNLF